MKTKEKTNVTLTIYPNTFGIGYVVSASPKDILDFGLKAIKTKELKAYQKKIDWLLDYCKPDIVLVQDFNKGNGLVAKRTHTLLDELKTKVRAKGLEIFQYTRNDIRQAFIASDAETKYDIAMKILEWYPMLESRKPKKRTAYLAEHYQMGVFDAFSLLLTHYYISK